MSNATSGSSARPLHRTLLRVRYSETDQMGTFYNSRALEWFECGRTEALRALNLPYTRMESQGVLLPLVEASVKYLGRARYDDLLSIETIVALDGRASLRFDMAIAHAATSKPVARGFTIHAITNAQGRPIRPPKWLVASLTR